MLIHYTGHVQGVGFRYTVKSVSAGFMVMGTIRNLLDGRVELVVEGEKDELDSFRQAILDEGLAGFVKNEQVIWGEAEGGLRGFEIVR